MQHATPDPIVCLTPLFDPFAALLSAGLVLALQSGYYLNEADSSESSEPAYFCPRGREAMPTYEYKCEKCNKKFESFHGVNDNVDECVFCGGPVRRVFHPAGILFKGSGFYATDYGAGKAGGNGEDSRKELEAASDKSMLPKESEATSEEA